MLGQDILYKVHTVQCASKVSLALLITYERNIKMARQLIIIIIIHIAKEQRSRIVPVPRLKATFIIYTVMSTSIYRFDNPRFFSAGDLTKDLVGKLQILSRLCDSSKCRKIFRTYSILSLVSGLRTYSKHDSTPTDDPHCHIYQYLPHGLNDFNFPTASVYTMKVVFKYGKA